MPIRWSSTYVMIDQAKKKKYVNTFVYELGLQQPTSEKCDQVVLMKLTANEWKHVGLFASLLVHADNAQQNVSSDAGPTLHLALPALEALHKAWDSCAIQSKYSVFSTGLKKDSDPYTMVMLLDPSSKDRHFKKYLDSDLHAEALGHAEKIFKTHHLEIYGEGGDPASPKKISKIGKLLRELSSDEGEEHDEDEVADQSPWLKELNPYLNSSHSCPTGMSIVQWWRVDCFSELESISNSTQINAQLYPAFSAAAQTITKYHSCLKGDIVEAIQVLHMLYSCDLMFHEPGPSSALELKLEGGDEAGAEAEIQAKENLD
ncbi:hypothetical protein PAXRUDRAFT_12432 [Paxillus rubicundulus Ve08.2h10]|uniref:HAT C-terminal dimerisation domain-containing protein n=1 Tax=Paxillus rubicundulus Ve08.2h10 TaxID=930991 RepID=A0A0D0E125_9AGAM|nr:hypothetical protein PAXRUDRAFT_12432 [Paxillus rubicundulus Ve08.2h10]